MDRKITQQNFRDRYGLIGISKQIPIVLGMTENKHGIDNPVVDLKTSEQKILGNVTFDGSAIVSPPVVITLQNQSGVLALQDQLTLTNKLVLFANALGLLVQDARFSFDTATGVLASASLKATGLTAGRVVFLGTGGLLTDDADMTFSVDRLTVTKITTTEIVDTGLTASALVLTDSGKKLVSLAPPAGNRLVGFDLTDAAITYFILGTGLSYDHTTHTISSTGGGSSTFLGLTDAPHSYAGKAGYKVKVNLAETALEFKLDVAYQPLTNGDPTTPELVFSFGDVVMVPFLP